MIFFIVGDSKFCEWKCDAHPFGGRRFVAGAEAAGASNTPLLPTSQMRKKTEHSRTTFQSLHIFMKYIQDNNLMLGMVEIDQSQRQRLKRPFLGVRSLQQKCLMF